MKIFKIFKTNYIRQKDVMIYVIKVTLFHETARRRLR